MPMPDPDSFSCGSILLTLIIVGLPLLTGCTEGPPTPDHTGRIRHPDYGTYPATVPFEQGMTIAPGQRTVGTIAIPMPPGVLRAICERDGGTPEDCVHLSPPHSPDIVIESIDPRIDAHCNASRFQVFIDGEPQETVEGIDNELSTCQ